MKTQENVMVENFNTPNKELHSRFMIRRDMPEVYEIERKAAEKSMKEPWDENDFLGVLRTKGSNGMVIEEVTKGNEEGNDKYKIIGFYIYGTCEEKVLDGNIKFLNLMKIGADPDYDRPKIEEYVVNRLKDKSMHENATMILDVDERDLNLQNLLNSKDFAATGIIRAVANSDSDLFRFEYAQGFSEIIAVRRANKQEQRQL